MRRTMPMLLLAAVLAASITSASAWWDGGHMQIAYVAYKRLDDSVKDKVDTLLLSLIHI